MGNLNNPAPALQSIICGLPCSLCRCRAQSASCKARRRLPFSVGPVPGPAAPSACKAMLWPSRGWLYVCMDESCLCPGIQRSWGKMFFGKVSRNGSMGSTAASSWKGLDGHSETWSDENHWFTVSCVLKSGQSCPKSRTSEASWVISLLITQRTESSQQELELFYIGYRRVTQQHHLAEPFGTIGNQERQLQMKGFCLQMF